MFALPEEKNWRRGSDKFSAAMNISGPVVDDKLFYLDDINIPKMKSVNLSSPVYADLSNSFIEFSLNNIKLCIGSLQIKSFGNFDYLLDNDPNNFNYPNGYHASRLFWSTKNARQKTIYHLYIDIDQTYHNDKSNHQTIEYPLSNKQIQLEQLYKTCEKYFYKFKKKISIETKTLRNLFKNNSLKSSNLSRFALALTQAFQLPSTKMYVLNLIHILFLIFSVIIYQIYLFHKSMEIMMKIFLILPIN